MILVYFCIVNIINIINGKICFQFSKEQKSLVLTLIYTIMKKNFYFLFIALLLVFSHLQGQMVQNSLMVQSAINKIDVWDFGAQQLDTAIYNNKLTVEIINAWYAGTITPGTSGNVLPTSFTAGSLTWTGGSNDRLRTTNTIITRYDANIASAVGYTGRLYVNGAAATGRFLTLTLGENDEVTIVTRTDAGGKLNFVNVANPAGQTDQITVTDLFSLKFVAKTAGAYKIFDNVGKPSYFRIYRKNATYVTITGTIDKTEALDLADGYSIVYKNAAGKTWQSIVTGGSYSITVPSGYNYTISLADANGYVITSPKTLDVTELTSIFNIAVKKVELYTVSGAITGLGTGISKAGLVFSPVSSSSYIPEPFINTTAGTYSVQLEANFNYNISATGINDYFLLDNTIAMAQVNVTKDLAFALKPVYKMTINTSGLDSIQKTKLKVTFTNLNESGYTYTFPKLDSIYLRNGNYTIATSGLDEYPLQLGATSNLNVTDAVASKVLAFIAVTNWSFEDATITSGTTTAYKGMLFTGTVSNEKAKGHLVLSGTGTVRVPVIPGQKLVITYYYSAKFIVVPGDTVKTSSGSTSVFETKEYIYPGTVADFMTITNVTGTSTYLTDVTIAQTLPYAGSITVGADKTYQTINQALTAVRAMVRPNQERIKIMIDPGNYEEMLMLDIANISLINAAVAPGIALLNKGVDIAEGAVRITSYYGHGYNYYSMSPDQKWNSESLRVNKENGYTNYSNTGSGTTNGSYWNATVVVTAPGFEAKNIIFENSYNQYISRKESEDVVVEWTSGGKGTRSTVFGNTSVQNKSFVERAAAIAFTKSADKTVLNNCRVVGRQDSFYGAEGARVVTYKGSLMGGTDYIFGGMTLVCYKTELAMNTSDVSTDISYITAAQQTTARGFLMYECSITSAKPVTETASTYLSKPGLFGRPWQGITSEVVFFNTKIDSTNSTGFVGKSMIQPLGWSPDLGGLSNKCYEYGNIEQSGENNSISRISWSHVLTTPILTDATEISTFNFTKGTDNWDPIADLISNDPVTGITVPQLSSIQIYTNENRIIITNVKSNTRINIYRLDGTLFQTQVINVDSNFSIRKGLWIVKAISIDGNKTLKILIQ